MACTGSLCCNSTMNIQNLAAIVASVIVAVGGGGAIVAGLSNWLGKVWAERFMEKEKARYQLELENIKASLDRDSDRAAQALREKLSLYKEAATPIIELIMLVTLAQQNLGKVTLEFLREFEKKRLTTTALLGLFAAMPVYEAYNALIDYLFDCLERKRPFEFPEFRILSQKLLSEMRKDVGVFSDELVYRGNR